MLDSEPVFAKCLSYRCSIDPQLYTLFHLNCHSPTKERDVLATDLFISRERQAATATPPPNESRALTRGQKTPGHARFVKERPGR